jgi:hypothetical protein
MMEPSCTFNAGEKPPRSPRRIVSIATGPGGALNEIAIMAPVRAVANIFSPGKQKRLPPMPVHEFGRRLGLNQSILLRNRLTAAMFALYLN